MYIVGQSSPRHVKNLQSEDVIVSRFVEDTRAECMKSVVAVSPIRFGSGTLNKVLEPLALGAPVLSTSIGVHGLDLQIGKEILDSIDSGTFAQHVICVLTESQLRS